MRHRRIVGSCPAFPFPSVRCTPQGTGTPPAGVAGNRPVRLPQFFQGQRRWEPAEVADLQAVGEQHDLHAAVVRVVAVSNGVDYGFGHDFHGDFICPWGTCAFRPGADGSVDLAEHEVHRLIDQLERGALVNLVGRNRLGDSVPWK